MFLRCKDGIDAIATAALNGPFVIYEFGDGAIIKECLARGFFKKLKQNVDYTLVSDSPSNIGKFLPCGEDRIGPIKPFNHFRSADFTSVVILDAKNQHQLFERLAELSIISPNNIYIDRDAWSDRTYRADDILQRALARVGPMSLSSVELLTHIIDCLLDIKRRDVPGDIANFGVYKGWSIRFIAEVCRQIRLTDRVIYGFDTFSGFPELPPDNRDAFVSYMKNRFGPEIAIHTDSSLELVSERLSSYENITLIKGDIRDTVIWLDGKRLSFALFDMDDYTPTKVSLGPTYEILSNGGFIVHDHFSFPSCGTPGLWGQRRAMTEFLETTSMLNLTGTNVFMKC